MYQRVTIDFGFTSDWTLNDLEERLYFQNPFHGVVKLGTLSKRREKQKAIIMSKLKTTLKFVPVYLPQLFTPCPH